MKKRAVIITGPGFQDEEYVYPYYRLLEAGFSLEVATKEGAIVYGKYGVPARATMNTLDLDANNFDLVVLPGGFEAPDRVRLLPEVLEFVRNMNTLGNNIGFFKVNDPMSDFEIFDKASTDLAQYVLKKSKI